MVYTSQERIKFFPHLKPMEREIGYLTTRKLRKAEYFTISKASFVLSALMSSRNEQTWGIIHSRFLKVGTCCIDSRLGFRKVLSDPVAPFYWKVQNISTLQWKMYNLERNTRSFNFKSACTFAVWLIRLSLEIICFGNSFKPFGTRFTLGGVHVRSGGSCMNPERVLSAAFLRLLLSWYRSL